MKLTIYEMLGSFELNGLFVTFMHFLSVAIKTNMLLKVSHTVPINGFNLFRTLEY